MMKAVYTMESQCQHMMKAVYTMESVAVST